VWWQAAVPVPRSPCALAVMSSGSPMAVRRLEADAAGERVALLGQNGNPIQRASFAVACA